MPAFNGSIQDRNKMNSFFNMPFHSRKTKRPFLVFNNKKKSKKGKLRRHHKIQFKSFISTSFDFREKINKFKKQRDPRGLKKIKTKFGKDVFKRKIRTPSGRSIKRKRRKVNELHHKEINQIDFYHSSDSSRVMFDSNENSILKEAKKKRERTKDLREKIYFSNNQEEKSEKNSEKINVGKIKNFY